MIIIRMGNSNRYWGLRYYNNLGVLVKCLEVRLGIRVLRYINMMARTFRSPNRIQEEEFLSLF
jgi:hypothetical protein